MANELQAKDLLDETKAIDTIDGLDCDLLVLGEMGIGNTTASAAIAASLAGGERASYKQGPN